MIRGIVERVVPGVIQRIFASAWGTAGAIADRELFQHYGLTSRPKEGAEAIFIRSGNSIIAIASDDRRYRLEVAEGEVALYDDLGQKVHLTRDGIVVSSPTKVTIDAPDLEVTGNISAGGEVSDSKGSMDAMRDTYNGHTHVVSGGVAQAPTARMT